MDTHNHSYITKSKCVFCDSFFQIKVKKLVSNARLENKVGDCGYDLFYVGENTVKIDPNCGYKLDTGIAIEMPLNMRAIIKTRSSYASRGLSVEGGVIDSSYRGELKVVLWNNSKQPEYVESGDKIAQLLFEYNPNICIEYVSELDTSNRGSNGFGSTGNK